MQRDQTWASAWRLGAVLGLLVVAAPALALGQPDAGVPDAPPSEASEPPGEAPAASDEDEARGLFTAGRAAFEAGEFERALEHFERAYELSGRPTLLYNIGNTHDRLRHDAEALEYLERYLEEVPDAPNAGFVHGRVDRLRATLSERRGRDEELARELAVAREVDATLVDAGVGFMVGGGVGLAVMIGPAVWWGLTSRQLNNCMPRNGCDPRPLASRQDAAIGLTVTLMVASLLAGGGGAALYLLAPQPEDASSASIACGLAGGGVGCQGRF